MLAVDDKAVMASTQSERRATLEALLRSAQPPLYVTPVTRERDVAVNWLTQFEGAGLDGVMAKPLDSAYLPGKRAMLKIKHARTADCVVVCGVSLVQVLDRRGRLTMLLGLYVKRRRCLHVGVTSAFTMAVQHLARCSRRPLRRIGTIDGHPWAQWRSEDAHASTRMPGGQSRWTGGKDLSWELPIERVVEVKYDHLQGDRFRHATRRIFCAGAQRALPRDCRYDQLEVTTPFALKKVFAAASRSSVGYPQFGS